jgi:uncharacterized membrane-anchored protein
MIMRNALLGQMAAICLGVISAPVLADAPPPPAQAQIEKAVKIVAAQHPQTGIVALPEAKATLNLGKDYYFLNAAETKQVLVDIWGNPPEVAQDALGMVFPAGKTALDDVWGAVITYDSSGYVADKDAKTTDYGELLKQMQDGEADINESRTKQGFDPQHLVGWAQQPTYDSARHAVIWAQNVKFGNQTDNSLNYDVRLLGRRGVLSLNLLSSMSKLPEIQKAAEGFTQTASFDPGAKYTDFVEGTDEVAAYGVGGLVAAGLGIAVAKKLGFLAIALGFGKKLLIPIILLFGFLRNKIAGLFGKKTDPLEGNDGGDAASGA